MKPRPVNLKKLSCTFNYSFEGRDKDIYVLSESKKDQAVYYFKDYKQIKAFQIYKPVLVTDTSLNWLNYFITRIHPVGTISRSHVVSG